MIISRTPFRISFTGGGSDLASFYNEDPGYIISTTINQYMYIALHPYFFKNKNLLKYSKTEHIKNNIDIEHPIIKEVFKKHNIMGVDLNSIADIPAGTGLGSSSTFTVGLLHSVYAYLGKYVSKENLAREACEIEIQRLKEPIGKQDQYAAAYGGLNFFTFSPDESVTVEKIKIKQDMKLKLNENLIAFYTNNTRATSSILKEQKRNISENKNIRKELVEMTKLSLHLKKELESGNIDVIGDILNESWIRKKKLASSISNPVIDEIYKKAMDNGAIGGKLLGAGGSGFLLFYSKKENHDKIRVALSQLEELNFNCTNHGSIIIHN